MTINKKRFYRSGTRRRTSRSGPRRRCVTSASTARRSLQPEWCGWEWLVTPSHGCACMRGVMISTAKLASISNHCRAEGLKYRDNITIREGLIVRYMLRLSCNVIRIISWYFFIMWYLLNDKHLYCRFPGHLAGIIRLVKHYASWYVTGVTF